MRATVVLLVVGALSASAAEVAVLANGFSLRVDKHEEAGNMVVLHASGGKIAMPADQVVRFEREEAVSLPPAKPEASAPQAAPPQPKLSPKELVARAAEKWGLPVELVRAVAKAESGYNVNAISPKGAIGLMQLMPETAAELNADPKDPEQNAEAGARYLRELLLKYNYSTHRALAAYNAGPGAVDKYRGVPPYAETRQYVDRVVANFLKSLPR